MSADEIFLRDEIRKAKERGARAVAEILSGPDMITVEQAAARLGLAPQSVRLMVEEGRVLELRSPNDVARLPTMQFTAGGQPYPEIECLLKVLTHQWAVYRFLTYHHPELGGATGIEAIKGGQGQKALETAKATVQGTFS